MPVSGFGVPSTLSAQDMGVPNYGSALRQGLQNAQLGMETYYKPKNLQEALLHQQLANKMSASNLAMQPTRQQMLNEQLQSLRTQNRFQPQNLQEALLHQQLANQEQQRIADLKKENPTFGQPGIGGVLGTLRTMDQFPQYFGNNAASQRQPQNQMQMNEPSSYIPSAFEQQQPQQAQQFQQGFETQPAQEGPNIYDQFRQALIAQYANKNRTIRETPEEKLKNAIELAQKKEDIKLGTKKQEKIKGMEKNISHANTVMENLIKSKNIARKHPEWFGEGTGGFEGFPIEGLGLHKGSKARRRGITDPEYGELETFFGSLQGEEAARLSKGNRVLAATVGLAGTIKPGFNKSHGIAMGNINQVQNQLYNDMQETVDEINKEAGYEKVQNPYVYVLAPNGQKIIMDRKDAKNAVEKHGGRYAE